MTLSWSIRKVQSIPHKSDFIHFPSLSVNIVNHWGINGCYGDYCPHLSGLTYLRNIRSQRRSKDRGLNGISRSVCIPLPQLLTPHSQHKQSKMARQSIEMRWAALMFWAPLWFSGDCATWHRLSSCHQLCGSSALREAWQKLVLRGRTVMHKHSIPAQMQDGWKYVQTEKSQSKLHSQTAKPWPDVGDKKVWSEDRTALSVMHASQMKSTCQSSLSSNPTHLEAGGSPSKYKINQGGAAACTNQ